MDEVEVRARGTEEGRTAISALRRAIDRMRAAESQPQYDAYQRRLHHEKLSSAIQQLEGFSFRDDGIRNALKLNHKIVLSDGEFREFVSYLIKKDPYYPAQCRMKLYKDTAAANDGGYPPEYYVELNIEPFYKLYLQFKGR
jgi:hypothetical protein